MTPAHAIAALDRQLARHGQTVRLRGQADPDDGSADRRVRAFVRGYRADELAGGIQQGDSEVVLSPTDLGADPARLGGLFIGERLCLVEVANPVTLADVVVRWNLWVRG